MLQLDDLLGSLPPRPDLEELIGEFVPPARFAEKRFADYLQRHPSQTLAAQRLALLAAELRRSEPVGLIGRLLGRWRGRQRGSGMYLDGGFGVGKTHLLAALWHEAPFPKAYLSFDELVFYGVGGHPNLDWLWPNHRATPHLKELLRASPGSLSHLERYEAGQEYAQNWARMGMIVALGASLAAAGGYVYGALPSNPREMAPSFYYATGGVAALGALMFGTSTFIANDNQQILDRAIANYNRDMAGRRKTQQPTLVP